MKPVRLFVAAALALVVVATGASAMAQPVDVGADHVVRYTRTLSQVAGDQGVSVWMHRPKNGNGWQLRLVDRTSQQTVGEASLPEWGGAEYYGYDVVVRNFGSVVVLIFEAAPAPGVEAPPGADSFQVAWAYGVPSSGRQRTWKQIASTRNSPLDGGDRLVFRKEAGEEQLVRLRTSAQTGFCGADLAAYQIFNPEELSFRSKLDLDTLTRGATEAQVTIPDDPFVPSLYTQFYLWYSATSDRYNADNSRTVIRPLELGDRDLRTAWLEGASGVGRGEYVTARVNDALKMRSIRIAGGHLGSAEDYEAFGSPREVLVSVEDGSRYVAKLPDLPFGVTNARGGVIVQLPRPIRTSCVSVVILDGREGARAESSQDAWKRSSIAISEVTPISELYGLAPDVAALVVVEKLLKEEDTRSSRRLVQLTSPLAQELVQILQSVLRSGSEEDRVRVIPLLRTLPSDASVPILVDMFEQAEPSDPAYLLVKPAIAAHGQGAAGALVRMLEEDTPQSERKYTDITRLIGRLGNAEHLNALLLRLGEGSRHVRNERVRAISRGGETMLAPLFAIAAKQIDEPGGEDALMAINSIGRKLHFRGQGAYEGSKILLEVLGQAKTRRTRLLALKALGFFATEGAIAGLTYYAEGSKNPLIRRQAVASLGRYPERAAREVLEAALFDESPDVRIAAIDGLGDRADRRQALASIKRYVERETWKPGLEVAYTIMADLGDANLLNQMESAIARDPTSVRAAVASEAMERAGHPISAALAAELIFDPSTGLRMRRNLVDLLGLETSDTGEQVLLRLINTEEPFEDLAAGQNERLRYRAVLALGRRDTESGRAYLVRIVRDASSTRMRTIALRGLAFSQDRSLIPELELLRASAPSALEDEFDSALEIIARRADIQDLQDGIEDATNSARDEREKAEESD